MPKKKSTTKKSSKKTTKTTSDRKLEYHIIENLIALQHVHADLAQKFDGLSKEISSLLKLFEMTAKTLSENPIIRDQQKDQEFLEKIDRLLDQNKTIAKGLTLMEEKIRHRIENKETIPPQKVQIPQPAQPQSYAYTPGQSPNQKEVIDSNISRVGKPLPRFGN